MRSMRRVWMMNGGSVRDLERLESLHLEWIERMPAVARDGEWLLLHADTDAYLGLGATADAVNEAAHAVLAEGGPVEFGGLLEVLFDRGAFSDTARLDRMLAAFGGLRVVHGHTPIALVLDKDAAEITAPLVYAGGRAVNVDHCLFAGGPGFVVELGEIGAETSARPIGRSWRFGPRRRSD
jgi:hypothetical protein